jgi:hypothetical protein
MSHERRELQSALVQLERVMTNTQRGLAEAGSTYGTLRSRVADGTPLADAFGEMAMPWSSVGKALDELERSRHQVRNAVFAVGLSEGMTTGDLARLYGFSRQLAARIASEVREGPR